ncbi:MAG: hypothetical protein QOF73_870 [Thermomicrobiales bacterium]|nr:hypothetical protein [Thermomicrobiales bacterium]
MRLQRAPRAVACRHGGSRVFRLMAVAALLAILGSSAAGAATVTAKAPSQYYVDDTGHALGEPFLSQWVARDGMTTLGFPVSEPVTRSGRIAQYFQYGYLQSTSKSKKSENLAVRPAGLELLDAQHNPERSVAGRRVGGSKVAGAFLAPDTGKEPKLTGRTKAYYERHGGTERFGKPVSASYVAFGMRVQWFEFGRLQWWLEDKKVQVAPVGLELASVRGIDTTRIGRGKLPPFEPNRFRTFHGDGTVAEARGVFQPVRIEIPRIAVNALIEQVGIVGGVMEVPQDAWNVGWYSSLAKPGERTNVVMAGHRDWWGVGPVVFWNLDQLGPGDKIYLVGDDGRGSTYVVESAWQVDAGIDAGDIISDAGGETLTLITCGGDFNGSEYVLRHIVRAARI